MPFLPLLVSMGVGNIVFWILFEGGLAQRTAQIIDFSLVLDFCISPIGIHPTAASWIEVHIISPPLNELVSRDLTTFSALLSLHLARTQNHDVSFKQKLLIFLNEAQKLELFSCSQRIPHQIVFPNPFPLLLLTCNRQILVLAT